MLIVLQNKCTCGNCNGMIMTFYSCAVEGKSDKQYEDEGYKVVGRASTDKDARVLIMNADKNSILHKFADKDGNLL